MKKFLFLLVSVSYIFIGCGITTKVTKEVRDYPDIPTFQEVEEREGLYEENGYVYVIGMSSYFTYNVGRAREMATLKGRVKLAEFFNNGSLNGNVVELYLGSPIEYRREEGKDGSFRIKVLMSAPIVLNKN